MRAFQAGAAKATAEASLASEFVGLGALRVQG